MIKREGISEVNASMGLGRDELPRQGGAGTRRVSGFAGRAPPGRAEAVGSPGEVGIEGDFGGRANRVFSGEHWKATIWGRHQVWGTLTRDSYSPVLPRLCRPDRSQPHLLAPSSKG